MKYLIVSNKQGKTHVVMVRHAKAPYGGEIADISTLCGAGWMFWGWKTVKTYQTPAKAKRAVSCGRCLRTMEGRK